MRWTHASSGLADRAPTAVVPLARFLQDRELWVLTATLGGGLHQRVTAAHVVLTDREVRQTFSLVGATTVRHFSGCKRYRKIVIINIRINIQGLSKY